MMGAHNEPYVPIEELAKYFTVSVSTIRSWVRTGRIPEGTYLKIGTTYRFKISDVEKALVESKRYEREVKEEVAASQHQADLALDADQDV
jgi:excisionase family DNA binding protein